MTIEDKRNAIMKYCDQKDNCDVGEKYPCPLKNKIGSCCPEDDTLVEKYFNMIRVMPDYNGEKEEVEEKPVDTNDVINHPTHYNREGAMESIDEMVLVFGKEAVKHFCLCNIWKYRYRAADKNGAEDVKKSDWYMRKYKELDNLG